MITDKQRRAVQDLVALSADARRYADSIDPTIALGSDLEGLRQTIASLGSQLAALQAELEDNQQPDAVFSDEEAFEFKQTFRISCSTQNYRVLVSQYGPNYLRKYPANIRVLIATALIDEFQSRGMTPLPAWTSIIASDGNSF